MAGVRCAAMAPPGAIVRYSRFTHMVVPWADPLEDPAAFVEELLRFAARQSRPPVLFCGGDWDLLAVSRARDRLADAFRFLLPSAELVEDLVDKARFSALTDRLGLPSPRTQVLRAGLSRPPALGLPFPVLLKPLTRLDVRWAVVAGEAKALEVRTDEALAAAWPRVARSGLDVLVQELVPGPEERIESYHAFVDADGRIAAEFTGQKLRTYPREYGHSTAVEITAATDVRDLGRDVLRAVGLRGVAKVDLKRDPGGGLHLLEVNPRFTLWNHAGAWAGVNLPAIVYADLVGRPRPPAAAVRIGVRWCDPLPDARAAAARGIPLRDWLPWVLRCEARASFMLSDPLPVVRGALWRLRHRSWPALRRARSAPSAPA